MDFCAWCGTWFPKGTGKEFILGEDAELFCPKCTVNAEAKAALTEREKGTKP